jgi:ribokinase
MPGEKKPIVVVGSINIDLVVNTERMPVAGETLLGKSFQTHPGGKGANQAVAVARLGYPVRMIGRLGDDSFGDQLREDLGGAGVNVDGVGTSPGSSGVAVIMVAESGENSIVITPGANALLTPKDIEANLHTIRSAGAVLTQLEIGLDTVEYLAQVCLREEVPLILDPAPAKRLPAALLRAVAWFTPNEIEAAFFRDAPNGASGPSSFEATAKGFLQQGFSGIVLKLGARGAYIATQDGMSMRLQPFPVKAIDTTAAGDAFNGAFAVGLLLEKDPAASARFATAAAALSVTRAGAQPSMPTRPEVERLLATQPNTHAQQQPGAREPENITRRDHDDEKA